MKRWLKLALKQAESGAILNKMSIAAGCPGRYNSRLSVEETEAKPTKLQGVL
ncbi:MAG: hypothetical protein Kow0077_18830 [Anaerolineae bacterium]